MPKTRSSRQPGPSTQEEAQEDSQVLGNEPEVSLFPPLMAGLGLCLDQLRALLEDALDEGVPDWERPHKGEALLTLAQDIRNSFNNKRQEVEAAGASGGGCPPSLAESVFLFDALYADVLKRGYFLKSANPNLPINPLSQVRYRLPELKLPTFNGEQSNWDNFYNSFKTLIIDDNSVDVSSKFKYLQASVSGPPADLVGAFRASPESFALAWSALMDRYGNPRIRAKTLFNKIVGFKPAKSDSVADLTHWADVFTALVSSLKRAEVPDLLEFIFYELGIRALPPDLVRKFEIGEKIDHPSLEDMRKFVNSYVRASKVCGPQTKSPSKSFYVNAETEVPSTSPSRQKSSSCPCDRRHGLTFCRKFAAMPPGKRLDYVRDKGFCVKCLRHGHARLECQYRSVCRRCSSDHHTLLHLGNARNTPPRSADVNRPIDRDAPPRSSDLSPAIHEPSTSQVKNIVSATNSSVSRKVLLPTILLCMVNRKGRKVFVRALADSCSQISVIDESLVKELGFSPTDSAMMASSFAGVNLPLSGKKIVCRLFSRVKRHVSVRASLEIVPEVVGAHPSFKLAQPLWNELKRFEPLADPELFNPSPVRLLLGADVLASIVSGGSIRSLRNSTLTAIDTSFGWIFFGLCGHGPREGSFCASAFSAVKSEEDLTTMVRHFWGVEEPPKPQAKLTKDEALAEEIFLNKVARMPDGRFSVALPFKEDPPPFGDNYGMAKRRFFGLEKKFRRDPNLKTQYVEFMNAYQALDHMAPTSLTPRYVIPHHPVFKLDASGVPKIRVVFDASAPTSSGFSLNDALLPGPKLQADIVDLLFKYRLYPIVFGTDVVKMFRQFLVHEEHRPFQTILWRAAEDQPLRLYALKTVTYGMKSSPYLAIRVLHHLGRIEAERFPRASKLLLHNTYVDDIMAGATSLAEAFELAEELIALLKSAGLSLSKWVSNSPEFCRRFCEESSPALLQFDKGSFICKVLGLNWCPARDVFLYQVNFSMAADSKCTKRLVLSTLARIFDPIGGLAPVTFWLKAFFQKLWMLKLDWDVEIPSDLYTEWTNFTNGFSLLSTYSIPRMLSVTKGSPCQLIGFADASEKGYAAVVYLRCVNPNEVGISFLAAKTRVAPLKVLSIPRLELCAALLLVQTMVIYKELIPMHMALEGIWAFSDSTTVLAWLRSEEYAFKPFVSNRVGEIHRLGPEVNWNYVPSSQNPADSASRGLSPAKFVKDTLFLQGPSFLREPLHKWSLPELDLSPEDLPERRAVTTLAMCTHECNLFRFISSCSSWLKIQRVCAYVIRLVRNLMCTTSGKNFVPNLATVPLSLGEMEDGAHLAIRLTQARDFPFLRNNAYRGPLLALRPFVDDKGLIRVGGRLAHANVSYDYKHPLLLAKDSHLAKVIIDYFHRAYLHAGLRLCQSLIAKRFWILSARSAIAGRIRFCTVCTRAAARTAEPLMGNLPSFRLNPSPVFFNTGVDFAGPLLLKTGPRRNSPVGKAYLAIFICMATKASHLELVSDLSTNRFLAALDRFVARRGLPSRMFSDCGRNFVGADRYLTDLHKLVARPDQSEFITTEFAKRGINWSFSPPLAPHFGGLWEAGIKSVKFHLKRIVGQTALTFEEWITLLARVEAMLNSRPLAPLGASPQEFDCLTPGHFLIGRPLAEIPDAAERVGLRIGRLRRWRLVSGFYGSLWKRFTREYLYTLQRRDKWRKDGPNLRPGQVVLIRGVNQPPMSWPLAVVEAVHAGSDGVVRVVTLRTSAATLRRPATMVVCLPEDKDDKEES